MPERLVVGTSGDAEKGEALSAHLPVLRFCILVRQARKPVLLHGLLCRRQEKGDGGMTKELRDRITAFRTAMSVVKSMLKNGVISPEDYVGIETILARKYGLNSSTIFR
jgi:hypothetical protein